MDAITAGQIRNGRDFRVSPFHSRKGTRYVKAVTAAGDLIAPEGQDWLEAYDQALRQAPRPGMLRAAE